MARQPVKYTKFPQPPYVPVWATYIEMRSPKFKIHNTIGTAKTAITNAGHGIMYRHQKNGDGAVQWVPVAVIQEGEAKSHPYRKFKADQDLEQVVLFTIEEEEL